MRIACSSMMELLENRWGRLLAPPLSRFRQGLDASTGPLTTNPRPLETIIGFPIASKQLRSRLQIWVAFQGHIGRLVYRPLALLGVVATSFPRRRRHLSWPKVGKATGDFRGQRLTNIQMIGEGPQIRNLSAAEPKNPGFHGGRTKAQIGLDTQETRGFDQVAIARASPR